jgi:hypothetical protein
MSLAGVSVEHGASKTLDSPENNGKRGSSTAHSPQFAVAVLADWGHACDAGQQLAFCAYRILYIYVGVPE